MEFGSSFIYAPKESVEAFEYVPESRYKHTVTGYSSATGGASYDDDGEVHTLTRYIVHGAMCMMRCNFIADMSTGHPGHGRAGGVFCHERHGKSPCFVCSTECIYGYLC